MNFAQLDNSNVVVNIVVCEREDAVDWLNSRFEGTWLACPTDTSRPGQVVAIGYTYSEKLDGFIPLQPFPSWTFNPEIFDYEAPIPKPEIPVDENNEPTADYIWNEEEQSWTLLVFPPLPGN